MTEVAIKSLLLEAVRYDPTDRIVSTVRLESDLKRLNNEPVSDSYYFRLTVLILLN